MRHPPGHRRLLDWCDVQLRRGMPPGLQGARLRCQYIVNATPMLVLLTVLMFLGLFSWAGVHALVSGSLHQVAIAVLGVIWFRHVQRQQRSPHYLGACLICQATILTGILSGQGTAIGGHYFFLFFSLTAPLVIPITDRRALALISTECLLWYLLLEYHGWPAHEAVQQLSPGAAQFLRLSVVASCSVILVVANLISENVLIGLERQVLAMANTDILTGLPNRRNYHEVLDQTLAQLRAEPSELCVAILDIDHFKRVNDAYGHEAGDEVLRQVAQRMRESKRAQDYLARIGGEEFAMVLTHTDLAQAVAALERLREQVGSWGVPLHDGRLVPVTVSIGVARWDGAHSLKDWLASADQALYTAKRQGRNQTRQAGLPPGPASA